MFRVLQKQTSATYQHHSNRVVLVRTGGTYQARVKRTLSRATNPDTPPAAEEQSVGELLPEEDAQVPGAYAEAMNPNTKLGKTIRSAVEELEQLNRMELEVLGQCESLLAKLGYTGRILQAEPSPEIAELLKQLADDDGTEEEATNEASQTSKQ